MRSIGLILILVLAGFVLAVTGPCSRSPKQESKTIAGVDANEDGVRDDVEKLIHKKYKDRKRRSVAREMAKALQASIVNPESTDDDRAIFAQDCSVYLFGADENIGQTIQSAMANTKERITAYLRYNARFSGQIIDGAQSKKEACSFDPTLLQD